ncbi:MAG: PSD1 and planctomycete cytochrome C domain-containing protein [Phycisphaerales bacterium]
MTFARWSRGFRRLAVAFGASVLIALNGHSTTPRDRDDDARRGEALVPQVRALLASKCFACHGPDEATRQSGLRLDTIEGQRSDLGDGFVSIVPGDAGASEVLARVLEEDLELRMPPPEAHPRGLSADEIDLLRRWIEAGAPWGEHWAFLPPSPMGAPRPLHQTVDLEVAERLHLEGLEPHGRAEPAAQLRRVSLDLVGLPPSTAEVEAFLADPSDASYEAAVERLLASPRFGERWARWWLDLARYADSKGYEKDDGRTVWPYRDWVIRAFNEDMPLDRFAMEQLAGDLLPDATDDSRLATSFHRQTMNNDEGGTSDEEFRVAAVVDRVNTTMEVFQGLTAACAQCHTHKFDPITHEEYYRLFAIFNQTADADTPDEKPTLAIKVGLDWLDAPLEPKVPVLERIAEESRRETRILAGGSFLSPKELVEPGVPAVLLAGRDEAAMPRDRREFAAFLFDGENPLTARVLANRIWAELFGAGIVETVEDFGIQGAPPSHPALLDALAAALREQGWSLKRLLREIVTSETYRRSSEAHEVADEVDPEHRLLARFPRLRLEAEAIRDSALAAGGLLSDRMFGPPVFPPQPDGVWTVIYSGSTWNTSGGEDRHRRGIYTYWRRTVPYPAMATFDAPSREVCVSRRSRTNTPLQALVTLNDPAFVECAQGLARRTLAVEGGDLARIDSMMLRTLGRRPTAAEAEELRALVEDLWIDWSSRPLDARRFAEDPIGPLPEGLDPVEAAAWTSAASVLLNLDEFLVKP